MKKIFCLIIAGVMLLTPLVQAEEAADSATPEESQTVSAEDVKILTEAVQQSSLLMQLKQKLAQIQYRYTLLQKNVDVAKESMVEMDAAITNLEMVIASLDHQIKDAEKQILNVKSQKERKMMDVSDLEEEIQILGFQLADQKVIVGELMTMLYVKRDVYYDEEGINPVKVLASPNSVSETLQKITYLDMIEEENGVQIAKMAALSEDLAGKWSELRKKQQELEVLDTKLSDELERLKAERIAQQQLLDELYGEKAVLEAMLVAADQREEELMREIRIYESNVKMMEEKWDTTNELLSEDQRGLIAQIEEEMLANFDANEAATFLELDWPVSPSRGITAFFDDDGYRNQFGVNHYALDIRANQGTSIFAPADGVVSEVIFDENSTKYAYIVVAHRMGTMTLYGHISDSAVSAGDYVTRGQILGFTGGTPGSIGSGARTTGPHLHFEVWQDGIRIDPLRYLSLDELPMDLLPEEYLDQVQSALAEQIKQIQEAIGL